MTELRPGADAALDDLAYLRGLVQSGAELQRPMGEGYVVAGVCYGVQMLLHLGQAFGLVGDQGALGLAIGLGPTVVFVILVTWLSIRNRATRNRGNVVSRAVTAVFTAFGLSNFALIAIVGSQAVRLQSLEVWLIYPCVVLALQGAAWMIVYALRRRAWIAWLAAGWYVVGVSMAFAIGHTVPFLLVGAFGFWGLMVAPGVYMMRQPKEA
jgi:hypothetical protein